MVNFNTPLNDYWSGLIPKKELTATQRFLFRICFTVHCDKANEMHTLPEYVGEVYRAGVMSTLHQHLVATNNYFLKCNRISLSPVKEQVSPSIIRAHYSLVYYLLKWQERRSERHVKASVTFILLVYFYALDHYIEKARICLQW